MKKLAIIGAGHMACIFAQNAKEMGVESHCFAWAEGAIAKEYVDFFVSVKATSENRLPAGSKRACRSVNPLHL